MDAKFRPRSPRRVDAHTTDTEQPLDEVLLDVNGLHAFKRDVDFFAHEDALVHVEGVAAHVEGEAPKVKQRTHQRQSSPDGNGPQEVLGVAVLLDVGRKEDGPSGAEHEARLPANQHQKPHDVLPPWRG